MKSYQEIKDEELENTKSYSDKKLSRYIKLCKFLAGIMNMRILWCLSIVPFVVINTIFVWIGLFSIDSSTLLFFLFAHLLYWKIYGERETIKFIEDELPELEIVIQVLEDIKKERNG